MGTLAPFLSRASGIVGKIVGTLFFGVFLAMGLAFTFMIARPVAKNLATYGWEQTEATLLASEVTPPQSDKNDPTISVNYTYTFGGTKYVAHRINSEALALETSDAYQLAGYYVAGAQVPCYVNPKDPGESVLQRKSPFFALLVLFPLIFVAIGGGGIWALWFWRGLKPGSSSPPLSSRPKTHGTRRAAMALFFGVFLLGGIGVVYPLFVRPLIKIVSSQSWTQVPCEVISSRVKTHADSDGDTYSVDVVYGYTYSGVNYTSNRLHFFTGSSSGYEGKAAVVRRYLPGATALCYVNPADPAEAVLERGLSGELWFGLIPLVFALVGFLGLRFAWKQKRGKPSVVFTAGESSTGAGLTAAEGPQTLRPVVSRKSKLAGFLLIALFWNGIVSVFLYNIFANKWSGFSWFPTLFLIPFVAVGLGLIGGVLYQFMALFNPRVRLTVSRGAVAPGEKIELDWGLEGRLERLQRLHIYLEGSEAATYRRGTSTSTKREVFVTILIADISDPIGMHAGATKVYIPPGTMHSFAAPNNKIAWTLHVKGEIPHWPDIDDAYQFTVMPKPLAS